MNNRNATRGWCTGIVWVPFLIMLGIGPAVSAGPLPGKRVIPWDGGALVKTPPVHPTTERPAQGMRAFYDLKNAALSFTTAGGAWKDRKWANIPCTLGRDEVVSSKPLPADATAYVINGNDKRDGCVNSEVIVVKP